MSRWQSAIIVVALAASPAAAQDVKTVLANASKAMGTDNLNSVHYYGAAADFQVGQNNNANFGWPRRNLNDYVRVIDFTQPAMRSSGVTWAAPVTGGPAAQGAFNQAVAANQTGWAQQLEIWVTPWGFLKGAMANASTLRSEKLEGKAYNAVTWSPSQKAPSGAAYRVVGYIDPKTNLVEKVDTWVENAFYGDLHVENIYTNYRDSNGLMFPASIVQKRFGQPTFEMQVLGAKANPSNLTELMTPPARGGGPGGAGAGRGGGAPGGGAPGGGRGAPGAGAPGAPGAAGAPQGAPGAGGRGGGGQGGPPGGGRGGAPAEPEKLAEGVWRITGNYNALAVEFSDHIVLFEPGPQNDARAAEIIATTRKVIPNKPIRFGVISHHHLDHTQGLPTVVAEGITIVTPQVNQAYLTRALSAPRTLIEPDALVKSKRKPVVEGFTGDRRVFQDATRTLEIHVIKGLPHADGLVVAYLPKERILVYADMFNLPPADNPVPNPPVVGTGVFADNIERLKLQPERILSVHNLNPNRLATLDDIYNSLARKRN
jgi:glyoxylase-like metal-dependent hydrolase (beta-lactamase superfamily II)